jgi:hypothetical protein
MPEANWPYFSRGKICMGRTISAPSNNATEGVVMAATKM